MNPVRRLPLDEDRLRKLAWLLSQIERHETAIEANRAEADRLAYETHRAGASYGALAEALGISRPGVQWMCRRGKTREAK